MAIYDIDNIDMTKVDSKSVFALDTNVLFWTHYSKASHPSLKILPYQVKKYKDFVGKLLENDLKFFCR